MLDFNADITRWSHEYRKSGGAEHEARIGSATPELLWQVLVVKRWELLKAMCGIGTMSIREAARRVGRGPSQSRGVGVVFPFDAVKVEFLLEAA